jgi:hypothetical protein
VIQDRLAAGQKIVFLFFFWEDLDTELIAKNFPEMELIVGGEGGYLYASEGD